MPRDRAIHRIVARAASLLAMVALVLALFQQGPTAMAAPAALHAAMLAQEGLPQDDCAHHVMDHVAPQEAAHHGHGDGQPQHDPAHQHHAHPCCVSAVSIVLPALALMQLPVDPGGHRVIGDVAERLEKRAPEGPNEPPRTADMS
jgi:hypothetical protein